MAMRAQIIGPLNHNRPEHCKDLFGTHFVNPRLLTAVTGYSWRVRAGRTQQCLEHVGSDLVRAGAGGHFNRFQVEASALARAREDDFQ